MFDLISWGIGYSLKQGAEWLKGNILFRKDLLEKLNKTAEKWNEELPNKYRMDNPEILFRPVENVNLENRPQLKVLRRHLMDGQIPEAEIWANAALEHIHFIRQKITEPPESEFWGKVALDQIQSVRRKLANDVNPLYEAEDEEIIPHLNELGCRLTRTIMQDTNTTLPLIYRQLQRIEARLDQLSPPDLTRKKAE